MKILRIIYDWPPPWQGLGPHPYELTVAQAKLGHTFDVFCGRWPKAGKIEEPSNVRTFPFWRAPLPGTMTITTAVMMFFKYIFWRDDPANQVDLIHSHGHFGLWIYLYRLFLKKFFPKSKELQTPLVVHFHNTVMGRWEASKEKNVDIKLVSQYLDWPLSKLSDQTAVKVADACIFVSEENRQDAIKFYKADPSKCFVVETGVNTHLFTPVGQEEFEKTRRDLGFDIYDKIILNHGVMLERKNIHILIEAMKFLPLEYKLLLVGPGDESYMRKLAETIAENHLEDRITRAGYTPYPQAQVSFQVSDLFVLPSSFEGFPKVVMQSLACGVPVLASGFKAKDEIKGLHYLEQINPQEVAAGIKDVLEMPGSKDIDLAYIRTHFSWDTKAHQVEEIYRKILSL